LSVVVTTLVSSVKLWRAWGRGSLANRHSADVSPALVQPFASAVAILPAPRKPIRGTFTLAIRLLPCCSWQRVARLSPFPAKRRQAGRLSPRKRRRREISYHTETTASA